MAHFKWLWSCFGKKRMLLIWGLMISVISSVFIIINPMLSQKLIDDVITPKQSEMLLPILGLMFCVQLLRTGLRYLMVICMEESTQEMCDNVRLKLFSVIQTQDYRFFGKMRTGDLMTRFTNDLDLVRHTAAWSSFVIVDSIVIYIAAAIYLLSIDWRLTLYLSATTPFIILVTIIFSKIIRPMYVELRAKLSDLNTTTQENIAGNRVVKAFAREEYELSKFDERNKAYKDTNLKTTYVSVKFNPIIGFLSQCMTLILTGVGGIMMINGELTAGEMIAFSSLTWALSNPLTTLATIINDIQRFFVACDMITEVYYSSPSIVDSPKALSLDNLKIDSLEFKDVSFSIKGTQILEDINISVKAGQTLGIMGTTGSGKTTLINMMMRIYDPKSGEVLINGESIKNYSLSSIRKTMSIAMQDVFLFSDSVDGNIAYGNTDMPIEEVYDCAKISDAHKFISRMQDGYETLIGERGVGLSGGQKQRISLARALAMHPSLLILDDTTSALDMETEHFIQGELDKLEFKCSKVIIAQRVNSVLNADEIIILDEGKIIERGTHKELIQEKGFYYNIWKLQNGIEEDNLNG